MKFLQQEIILAVKVLFIIYGTMITVGAFISFFDGAVSRSPNCEVKNHWHYLVLPVEYSCKAGAWMSSERESDAKKD